MNDTKALYDCVAELDECFSSFVELEPTGFEDNLRPVDSCYLAAAMANAICLRYFSYPALHISNGKHGVAQTIFGCVDGFVGGIWFDHYWQIHPCREPDIKFDNWSNRRFSVHWKTERRINNVQCTLPIKHYLTNRNSNLHITHITQMNEYLADLFIKDGI